MNNRKKLLLSFSQYTMVSFGEKGINYILFFIMTSFLAPSEMGVMSLFLAVLTVISPFINLGTYGAAGIAFQKQKEDFKDYFASCFRLNIIAFLIILLLVSIVGLFLKKITGIPYYIILLVPVIAYFDSVKLNYTSYSQVSKNIKNYSIITFLYVIISLLITFIAIKLFHLGYQARVLGFLISSILCAIYVKAKLNSNKILGQKQTAFLKDAFKFGISIIPHSIGAMVIDISDRFFIKSMTNLNDELGFYSTAYTVTSLLSLFSASFFAGWLPYMNSYLHEGSQHSLNKIVKVHVIYLSAFIFISICFAIAIPFIFKYIINIKYIGTLKYVPYLILTLIFQNFYLAFAGIIFFTKKNKYFTIASIINISNNIILNYILINKYGAIGAAYATLISTFIFAIIIMYFSNSVYPLPWKYVFSKKNIK